MSWLKNDLARARHWLCCALLLTLSNIATANTIMVLGDSISAAYGIEVERGWVHLLQQHLRQQAQPNAPDNLPPAPYQVINASISGETTGGALQRLPALLARHQPTVVIIELGGNDGLRGFPISRLQDNLRQLIEQSRSAGARVLLAGMRIPPNYGPRYTRGFYETYTQLAQQLDVALAPFILEDIAVHPELMQADGIHPTAEAQPRILANILPHLTPLL